MHRLPDVSFVVPLKDDPLIDRLLSCLSKQTMNDFELLIVDASENHDCSEIVEKWDFDHKIIKAKGGRGTARNIGAKIARGEALAFVDADVIVPPNFADVVARGFSENEELVAMGFPVYPTKSNKISDPIYRILRFLDERSYWFGRPRIPTTCAAYRRSIFEKRFFTDLIGEDVLFSADILKFGKAAFAKGVKVYEEPRRWVNEIQFLSGLLHYYPSYIITLVILSGLHSFLMPKQEYDHY